MRFSWRAGLDAITRREFAPVIKALAWWLGLLAFVVAVLVAAVLVAALVTRALRDTAGLPAQRRRP